MREQDCISEALAMARAFVRIGVKRFGLTRTDIAGKLVENGYRVGLNEGAMQLSLPLPGAAVLEAFAEPDCEAAGARWLGFRPVG